METTNNFNIISMRTLFPAILGCLLLIGCVRNQSVTTQNDSIEKVQNGEVQSENVQSKGNNILCNIIDSLLKVYPKAMANPIQKSDFIAALDKSVKNLSPHTLNMLVEQIPFSLEGVQNVPNQPGGKYLSAFEYSEYFLTEGETDSDGYATLGDSYGVKIYGFAALDKEGASQLEEHVKYKLSGNAELVDKPTFTGYDDNTITMGVEIKNITVTKIQ